MNNIIQFKDLFQQWHHQERKIGHGNLKDVQALPPVARRRAPLFIKLEAESPLRGTETEDPEYDSFNEHETDFCRDSSDTDSSDGYVTDGIATMEVLEYELDDSSASEDLYTDASSSGTDELVVAAVAHALFETGSSGSGSDTFEILADDADTEASDAPTDPELGRSDYWTCIKCKNGKNNPMYRFCEKCYQIRKTHFPPRPKHRKKRRTPSRSIPTAAKSPGASRSSSSLSAISDDIGNLINSNKQSKSIRRRKNKSRNSAGDSSCSSQELSTDEQQPPFNSKYLEVSPSSQETYCSEIERIVDSSKLPKHNLNIFESNYPNSQDSVYPNSQEFSQTSSLISQTDLLGKIRRNGDAVCVQPSSSVSSEASTMTDPQESPKSTECCEINSPAGSTTTTTTTAADKKKSRKRKASFEHIIMSEDSEDDGAAAKQLKTLDHEDDNSYGMCRICLTQPKNAAFLHNRFIHIYACYKCSVKVWNKRKKCPICNSQVKTVLKFSVY